MSNQSGMSLSEVLISLLIASIIMMTLSQLYLSNKRYYLEAQQILEANFDAQWVSELLSDSIRRAGFTPCLGVEQLKTADRRNSDKAITAMITKDPALQFIQINRMNEFFAEVLDIQSPTQIIVSDARVINKKRPFLIADCEHAEVHRILSMHSLSHGYQITLVKPLLFAYPSLTYMGEWIEEQWFMKKNHQGINALYYKLFQIEELTSVIHSLQIKKQFINGKQLIEVVMGLDHEKTYQLNVAVRGS